MTEEEKLFFYWIKERWLVLQSKESGRPKPWSKDRIFQSVYFCNVRREDDKVTQWVRQWTKNMPANRLLPYLTLARMLNWPPTLNMVRPTKWDAKQLLTTLKDHRAQGGKIFGGAYLITTCGVKMDKLDYVVSVADQVNTYCLTRETLRDQHAELMQINGLGSFLAAQVVADLKNTPQSWLTHAPDWYTWSAIGPGSRRGINAMLGKPPNSGISNVQYQAFMENLIVKVNTYVGRLKPAMGTLCAQDVQNCLCEYSKYMRVRAGGNTKRNYQGAI